MNSKERLGVVNFKKRKKDLMKSLQMSNGYCLYWKDNEVGGRTYFSDEIGGGVFVWDTSLVYESTLKAAIAQEAKLNQKEKSKVMIESKDVNLSENR